MGVRNVFTSDELQENTILSKLNHYDLHVFLKKLSRYYLELRDSINSDDKFTFGVEIESDKINRKKIEELRNLNIRGMWSCGMDDSVVDGFEVNSPLLFDRKRDWQELKIVCEYLKRHASITDRCGGHIHIGCQAFDDDRDHFLNFLKLWSAYENIIYRFCYGNFLTPRKYIDVYASPMKMGIYNNFNNWATNSESIYDIINDPYLINDRYVAFNLSNAKRFKKFDFMNTIEFRCPNGSFESVIWQNNINFFDKLINYSKSSNFNDDIVNKRFNYLDYDFNLLESYNKIYFNQAIELADLIFDNNLDKAYFLRQYFKSFDEASCCKLSKAKTFVKG